MITDNPYTKELNIRTQLKGDFPLFARNCLKIKQKPFVNEKGEVISGIIPFVLNRAQIYVNEIREKQKRERGYVRLDVLKGRQQGMTTEIQGMAIHETIHNKAYKTFIVAHTKDATDNLFEMTQRLYNNLPPYVRPHVNKNNAHQLSFTALDSGYKVGTAAGRGVGRSHTINFLHGSEVALWENAQEIASGLMQSVPPMASEIFLESTARGEGNYFHEHWQLAVAGESDFIPVFVPWYWQDEYTRKLDESFCLDEEDIFLRNLYHLSDEQLFWRKKKIGEMGIALFKQEYPFNPEEAFKATTESGIIRIELVEEARTNKCTPYGPILIGVDCARSENGDKNVIAVRQGRFGYDDFCSFNCTDTMLVVGKVVEYIRKYSPKGVMVDVCGIGAGVVDRLRELGYSDIIFPVNAGSDAFDKAKYHNKKSEMWGLGKEWFEDGPCQIPNRPKLITDLCTMKWKDNSNSQKVTETTEILKKRMGQKYSPDEAAAFLMTFAYPFSNYDDKFTFRRVRGL